MGTFLAALAVAIGGVSLVGPAADAADSCGDWFNAQQVHPRFGVADEFNLTEEEVLLILQEQNCETSDGHFYNRWRVAVRVRDNTPDGAPITDIAYGLKTSNPAGTCERSELGVGSWHVPQPVAADTTTVSPTFRFSLASNGQYVWADIHVTYSGGRNGVPTDTGTCNQRWY